jgi:hypothetical protein
LNLARVFLCVLSFGLQGATSAEQCKQPYDPVEDTPQYNDAKDAMLKSQHQTALAGFSRVLARQPCHLRARYNRAVCYQNLAAKARTCAQMRPFLENARSDFTQVSRLRRHFEKTDHNLKQVEALLKDCDNKP